MLAERHAFLPRPVLLTWSAVFSLLLGSVADFLVGSPGDASLLLAAFLTSAVAVRLLFPDLSDNFDRRLRGLGRHNRCVAFALLCFASVAVFAKIAEDVVEHESPRVDLIVSFWVHGLDTPTLDSVMDFFSSVGSFDAASCLAVGVLVWCWIRKDHAALVGLLGVQIIDKSLHRILRDIFERPRPAIFQETATLRSYSFPSGHAIAAVATYGMIAVVVGRLAPRLKKWLYGAAAILALLIGLSRIYLGVHWFTDVVAGYAVGAAVLFAGISWLEAHPAKSDSVLSTGRGALTYED